MTKEQIGTPTSILYQNGIDIMSLDDQFNSSLLKSMEEYKEQELTAEREKSKKLVEATESLLKFLEEKRPYVAGLGAPINLIKQSLTEYKKQ